MASTEIERLNRLLEKQGRTKRWLAREVELSYSYVNKILAGDAPAKSSFLEAAAEALSGSRFVVTSMYGEFVKVPRSVFERRVSLETIRFEEETAWKEAWIEENGRDVLAVAAERAWSSNAELVSEDTE